MIGVLFLWAFFMMILAMSYLIPSPQPSPGGRGGESTVICTCVESIHASYVYDKQYKLQRQSAPSPSGRGLG